MNNEEWLKSLSTEELAEIMTDDSDYCCQPEGQICMGNCADCCKDWLKQEREE